MIETCSYTECQRWGTAMRGENVPVDRQHAVDISEWFPLCEVRIHAFATLSSTSNGSQRRRDFKALPATLKRPISMFSNG
eukprot:gene8635-biopygen4643